jgi:hypothetical protein
MATVTLAIADALLKEVYEPKVNDQLQSETIGTMRIEKTSQGVSSERQGKYVVFSLRTARNHGIGARNELEALPVAHTNSYAAARVQLAYLYGAAQLSGQIFELAETNEQAFANEVTEEIDGLREGLKKDISRQFYGTAIGKLCTSNAGGSVTTLVMADSQAIYLEQNMFVDLFNSSDVLHTGGTNLQITSIVSASGTTTVTFTPAVTGATASGEYFVRNGSRARETIGLTQIVSNSGVLYNVDPAVVNSWRSVVSSNGGVLRPLSEGLMIKLTHDVRRGGGGSPTVGFCNFGVERQYFNLLSQQRRYQGRTDFAGGFSGLSFTTDAGEIPIVIDQDCPWNSLFFINEKQIKLYQAGDWSFMDRDGSSWQRLIDSVGVYDVYQTYMYKYYQMGTKRRNAHGLLSDLTE